MAVKFPAELYYNYRPTYPAALFALLRTWVEAAGIQTPASVADIGCGSGQATVGLAQSGLFNRIIAIEIDAAMLEVARARPELQIAPAHFIHRAGESTGLKDSEVDVVLCASAFHWMQRDLAVKEFIRILKKPGLIFLAEYAFPVSAECREFEEWIKGQLHGPWEIEELRGRTPFRDRAQIFAEQRGVSTLGCREVQMHRDLDWKEMTGLIRTQSRFVRYRDSLPSEDDRLLLEQNIAEKVRGLLGEGKTSFDFRLMAAGFVLK